MAKHSFKEYLGLAKEAFEIFRESHPVKFASAIAYFSLFALPCMFLIIVSVLKLFFSKERVYGVLQDRLTYVVGDDGATILVEITENYGAKAQESTLMLLLYLVVVFWLSTQLFRLFQNSLNELWRVKPDFDSLWRRIWIERGVTLLFVLGTGLLFFASLGLEKGLGALSGNRLNEGTVSVVINLMTVALVFLWFALLYQYLTAVKLGWKPTLVGAALTTVLFFIGFWLLWNFVVVRDLEDLYGGVASIIRVALWIFYSSLVFLYGASFTKAYTRLKQHHIEAEPYAYRYKLEQVRE